MSVVDAKVAGNLGLLLLQNGKLNQLDQNVFKELGEGFDRLVENPAVQVIVIAAPPGPIFCAGADVKMIAALAQTGDAAKVRGFLEELHGLVSRIDDSPKPVIAAVSGVCFGGGFELALACDYIVTTPVAQLALPEVTLGIIPGLGGTQRLPRRIGVKPALELILTGKRISAQQALETGVVDKVIEGDFIAGVKAFAAQVLSGAVSPKGYNALLAPGSTSVPIVDVLAFAKGQSEHSADKALRAVLEGCQQPLATGLHMEIGYFVDCAFHPDATAGITAMLTKQPAKFQKVVQ